jgi:acyl-CoA oxidase
MATVFAQLEVNGVEHGVHAILVPIRDEAGHPLTGIRIEDNGAKVGLNGIDNGRIWFDRVRVPRDHLLDRFATVTEDGRYESPIESSGRRFFTMLGTLVAGRVSIAAASVSVAKRALVTAVRYSDRRHQFGPDGSSEVPILWFTTQRRTLLPRLATTYALHFAVRDLTERYDQSLTSPPEDAEEHDRELPRGDGGAGVSGRQ